MSRNLWLAFLSFGTHLVVAVGSVKHSDLFREKPINLPLLNVDLPLVTFFWVAPLLFLIFHAYLLLNLTLMVDNVHRYNAMRKDADLEPKDDDDFRLLLTNFPFVHSFFDHQPRCSHVKDAAPQVLALETMTLIPRFLDTSAVLSAKAKCLVPSPCLQLSKSRACVRSCGLARRQRRAGSCPTPNQQPRGRRTRRPASLLGAYARDH